MRVGRIFSDCAAVPRVNEHIYLYVRHVHAYAPPSKPLACLIARARIAWHGGYNRIFIAQRDKKKGCCVNFIVIDLLGEHDRVVTDSA